MEEYPYRGAGLTPKVFAYVLVNLFDGKEFDKKTAVQAVNQYHLAHGGKAGLDKNVFKKATDRLRGCGLRNPAKSYWVLDYKEPETARKPAKKTVVSKVEPVKADRSIGRGKYAVYLYYYEAYHRLAVLERRDSWECKIGRTDKEPLQRVVNQTGTSYPERPHIALVIYCDDSYQLESAIHGVLKFHGRWLKDAPGNEWFLTSPDMVEGIYNSIAGMPLTSSGAGPQE